MEIKSIESFDPETKKLIELSQTARTKAYSVYSKFMVGAALLCPNERTALVKAVSEGDREFEAVAVAGVAENCLVSPCGACRQFLAEFNPQIKVYLYNPDTGKVGETSLAYLLPEVFKTELKM